MTRQTYIRPLDLKHGQIDMSHGAGGRAGAQLVEELFARHLDNEFLRQGDDGAVLPPPTFAGQGERWVVSTDCHVVSPLFFPGGDIGCLSVHGTINDVAMMGARPLALTAGFIIEEGFALADLDRIVASMAAASRAAGVPVVAGDTKVVERGKGDGVFITTTGFGVVPAGVVLSGGAGAAGPCDSAFGQHRRSRHGDHEPARGPGVRVRPSSRTRPRCMNWWRRCWRRALICAACATRRAAGWRRP